MIFDERLLTALPFYDDRGKQAFRQEKCFRNLKTFQQLTDLTHLPPFEIMTGCTGTPCSGSTWDLYDVTDTLVLDLEGVGYDICTLIDNYTGLNIDDDYREWFVYEGGAFVANLPTGLHYIKATIGSCEYYSEVFNICTYSDKIILDYGHTCDIHNIIYRDEFQNKIVFPEKVDLSKPTYEPIKTGIVRDGRLFIDKTTAKKIYKMVFYAPEYMADAMSILHLHDTITITNKDGDTMVVDEVNANPVPFNNCFFRIDLEFISEPFTASNCCTDLNVSLK